jgi:hypothetical protein
MLDIKKLAVYAALVSNSSCQNDYLTIDESVRYSDGKSGMALSISSYAIDYLKVLYLPHLYDKIDKFTLPERQFNYHGIKGTI